MIRIITIIIIHLVDLVISINLLTAEEELNPIMKFFFENKCTSGIVITKIGCISLALGLLGIVKKYGREKVYNLGMNIILAISVALIIILITFITLLIMEILSHA